MKLSRESRQALYITGLYVAAGLLWIIFSDRIVGGLVDDPRVLTTIQSWKGSGYILLTAVLLFLLVRGAIRRQSQLPPTESEFAHRFLDVESMAPIGVFRVDAPGEAMFINRRAAAVMGKPVEELVGAGWQSLVHEDDRDHLVRRWHEVVAQGATLVEEFRIRRPDGGILWVIGTASPQMDERGRVVRYIGALSDISERKAAESERDEFQKRMQLAMRAAHVGIWSWDFRTNDVFYSLEWKKQLGYEDDEIKNEYEEWHSRVHPDDIARVEAGAQAVISQGGSELREEFRMRHKDGRWRWILAQGAIALDENGRPARLLGAHVDITEQKRTEAALQDSLGRYEELTELSPIGIYHADRHGKINYVNPRVLEMAGLKSSNDLLGDAWVATILEEDRERVVSTWEEAVANGAEYDSEYRIRVPDGRIRWIHEHARPVRDEAGNVRGFIGTTSDSTPMRKVLAQLHQSEAYRRQIVELEPDCVKVLSPEGKLLEMNPAGLGMIDADSLDQVRGSSMSELVLPEDRERFVELHRKVMSGESGTLAFDVVSLKGVRRHLETRAVPLREGGKVVALLGVTRDMTEQRKAEELIRQSEIRFRELYESNPLPMCIWDPESLKFLAVNDAMVEHYGYTRDELLGMSVLEIRPPEDRDKLLATRERSMQGAYSGGIWRHIKKSGEVLEVEVRSHPIGYGNRKVMLAQMMDITSQRRVEAALQKEQAMLHETTARLNHILMTGPTVLYSIRSVDGEFIPTWISENVERIFGYSRKEALEPDWWLRHMHPDDRERIGQRGPDFETHATLVDEFRFYRKDGRMLWVRAESRRVNPLDEKEVEIVGSWSDITEDRKTQERLRLDAAAFESTRDGVLITDLDSKIISVNRALLAASGYSEEELLGRTPRLMQSGRHEPEYYQAMWHGLKRTGYWQGEVWNRGKNGAIFPVWLTISAVYNDRAEPTHYVAIYTDISKLKQSEEELHTLAHYDPLTKLPNRLLLQSRLEHAVDQAERHEKVVALIFLDLDDFKKVNDSLGHIIGDELLRDVARRLQSRVREEDTLARLGGDEFVVLLESLDRPEDAANVARDLLQCLAQPFRLPSNHELHVHGSIGISVYPADGKTPPELLRAADTAMYRAKDEGGDRLLFFTSKMSADVLHMLEMENALRLALERGEFMLNLQPKVRVDTNEIRSVEALLRWRTSEGKFVPPGEFIPVAERTNLIVPIGNWAINAACAELAHWRELGFPPIRIAVNVSARQFRSTDLEQTIRASLHKYEVPAEFLTIELTESMLMQRPEQATQALMRLKEIGVSISLDDFGTGFSSLAYLSRFPIDTLKVDGTFVQGIEQDASARQIIRAIVDLADGLGLDTVAEGVETEAQKAYLVEVGCHTIQGYLFSKPLSSEHFVEFFRTHSGARTTQRRKRTRKTRAASRK